MTCASGDREIEETGVVRRERKLRRAVKRAIGGNQTANRAARKRIRQGYRTGKLVLFRLASRPRGAASW